MQLLHIYAWLSWCPGAGLCSCHCFLTNTIGCAGPSCFGYNCESHQMCLLLTWVNVPRSPMHETHDGREFVSESRLTAKGDVSKLSEGDKICFDMTMLVDHLHWRLIEEHTHSHHVIFMLIHHIVKGSTEHKTIWKKSRKQCIVLNFFASAAVS